MQDPNNKDAFVKALMQHGKTLQMLAQKQGVQHLDTGGQVLGGPSATVSGSTGGGTNFTNGLSGALGSLQGGSGSLMNNTLLNPGGGIVNGAVGAVGGALNAIDSLTQNNFQGSAANLQAGTNAAQLNNAYGQAQTGINQAGNLVSQLQSQNGITNQANNYNALGNIANGTGPNPAQTQLAQATSANVANQAALMAGQRGSGSNAGLIARQAAQQGAATQQQAAGQAASLQSTQQLNALNAQAGIAQNEVNSLGQATQNYNTGTQNEQNILQNANSGLNTANVGMQSNLNNVNAQISQGNQQATNGLIGGLTGGLGSAVSSMFAEGGEVSDAPDDSTQPVSEAGPSDSSGGGDPFAADTVAPANVGASNLGASSYAAPAPVSAPNIGQASASGDVSSGLTGGSKSGGSGGLGALAALFANGGDVQPTQVPPSTSGPQSAFGKFLSGLKGNKPSNGQPQHGIIGQWLMNKMNGGQTDQQIIDGYNQRMAAAPGSTQQWANYMGAPSATTATGAPTAQSTYDMYQNLPDAKDDSVPVGGSTPSVGSPDSQVAFAAAKGGRVPVLLSPGEKKLTPKQAKEVANGKMNPMKGKTVPGKPVIGGAKNSYANDIVPDKMAAGSIVIPRAVTQSKNPEEKAVAFVRAHVRTLKAKK